MTTISALLRLAAMRRRAGASHLTALRWAAGLLWRLWAQRGKPVAGRARADSIDGDYRVVGKAQLTH